MIAGQDSIEARTADRGGGTFDALTLLPFEPVDGYAVALCPGTAATTRAATGLRAVARMVAQEWGSAFVGTWLAADGRVHVDPVEYVRDRSRALRLGRERRQEAIYSFADGVAVAIERPPE